MNNLKDYLGGRILDIKTLESDIVQELMKRGSAIIPATYTDNDQKIRCRRCLMTIDTDQFADSKYYCRNCINLGKLTKSTQLVITPTNCKFLMQNNPLAWDGHLTDLQKSVSDELIVAYDNRQDHLIWAVTGAGKTEMTFPLIEKIILNNERVALCSPRVDVCLELYPRIRRAFPNTTIGLFHGQSKDKYQMTQIMIATTHQLIRFEQAFDVLIIDEVDSYPLAGNQMLANAIKKSVKKTGNTYYLSATPPKELMTLVQKKHVGISKLYQRFHGHPLPEPICHLLIRSVDFLGINPRVMNLLKKYIKAQKRFLIFFPKISQMLKFEKILHQKIPRLLFTSVSSKDPDRLKKVEDFRSNKYQVLLTTTILERGVTFKNVAVIVLDADKKEFSKTSLIQIAGRAGRAQDSFDDEVHYFYQNYNNQIKHSCSEIKYLNSRVKK